MGGGGKKNAPKLRYPWHFLKAKEYYGPYIFVEEVRRNINSCFMLFSESYQACSQMKIISVTFR